MVVSPVEGYPFRTACRHGLCSVLAGITPSVEVAASDEAHLAGWLSHRLGHPLAMPSLQEYGYALVGGGSCRASQDRRRSSFMYQSEQGERLTLYVTEFFRRELDPLAMRVDGHITFYWANHSMRYALSGRGVEQTLREIALVACDALGGRADTWKG